MYKILKDDGYNEALIICFQIESDSELNIMFALNTYDDTPERKELIQRNLLCIHLIRRVAKRIINNRLPVPQLSANLLLNSSFFKG